MSTVMITMLLKQITLGAYPWSVKIIAQYKYLNLIAMRVKDERILTRIVDKIIDSKILLTGDGDFEVTRKGNDDWYIIIRNLFGLDSNLSVVFINVCRRHITPDFAKLGFPAEESWAEVTIKGRGEGEQYKFTFNVYTSDHDIPPCLDKLRDYLDFNKDTIVDNDKEYGRSITWLTDRDLHS